MAVIKKPAEIMSMGVSSLTLTSVQGRVFQANHLATVLANPTHNKQYKHRKPKQLNLTKPN